MARALDVLFRGGAAWRLGCSSEFSACQETRTCEPGQQADGGEGGNASGQQPSSAGVPGSEVSGGQGGVDADTAGGSQGASGDSSPGAGDAGDAGGPPTCDPGSCQPDDARLKELSLAPAVLVPAFDRDTASYAAKFTYFEPTLRLSAAPVTPTATMTYLDAPLKPADSPEIAGTLADSPTTVSVEVTASDKRTKKSYAVALQRAALKSTYFKAFNSRKEIRFGSSVALDGDTALIGAPFEDSPAQGVDGYEAQTGLANAGAAYVAVRGANGTWQRQAYLKASDTAQGAAFGAAIAIDGDTVIVGAAGVQSHMGEAYVFKRTNGTWAQQTLLTEPTRVADDFFGSAVAVQGDHVYVTASSSSNLFPYNAGAVYSWTRSGTTWTLDNNFPDPPAKEFADGYAGYGEQLVASGDRLAASGGGFVHIMLRQGATWTVEGTMSAADMTGIAFDGDTLAIASIGVGVHIYTRTGSTWAKQTTLLSFDAKAEASFASSVAMSGNLVVVGSRGATSAGGISTFVRNGSSWENGEYYATASVETNDQFAYSLATSGAKILVGTPCESSNAKSFNGDATNNLAVRSGAVFILE